MGFLDRLFGRKEEPSGRQPMSDLSLGQAPGAPSDEQAIQRYRYMVQTAPPEMVEQAHEEAFAKLTPAQRAQVLPALAEVTPEPERAAIAAGRDDPKTLARLATRAEIRDPGVLERTLGRPGYAGPSLGGMMAGSLFASLVGSFVGSMIAHQFFAGLDDATLADAGLEPYDTGQASETMVGDFGDASDFGGDIGDI